MLERLLMSPIFHRYIEAWTIILMPWVLWTEQEAVSIDDESFYEEIDYDYERDRLEKEFTLTPEEEQEMEDRREVWMDSPLKFEDTGRPFPDDVGIVTLTREDWSELWDDEEGELRCWDEDDWREDICSGSATCVDHPE